MVEKKVFLVGSKYFFGTIDGFNGKEEDYVHLMDGWFFSQPALIFRNKGKDVFLYPDKGLQLIEDCIRQNDPLTAGKFLVPEFCDYIGATLEDIKRLETLFYALDEKHRYETFIYECYAKNGGLWLTESQKTAAYEIYKNQRL